MDPMISEAVMTEPMVVSGQGMGMSIFFILYFIFMAGIAISWILFIVAVWKGMRAHQSIASSLEKIADKPGEVSASIES